MDNICKLNKELILLNLSLLRKLCNLSGEEFGFQATGTSKQNISRYEKMGDDIRKKYPYTKKNLEKLAKQNELIQKWDLSKQTWANLKDELSYTHYIAIRHFFDYEHKRDKKRKFRKRRTLGDVLFLIDTFSLLDETKQAELIKYLFDLRNNLKGKKFDFEIDEKYHKELKELFNVKEYSTIWYKKYQTEIQVKLLKSEDNIPYHVEKEIAKALFAAGQEKSYIINFLSDKVTQKNQEKTTEEIINEVEKELFFLSYFAECDNIEKLISVSNLKEKEIKNLLINHCIEKEAQLEEKEILSLLD